MMLTKNEGKKMKINIGIFYLFLSLVVSSTGLKAYECCDGSFGAWTCSDECKYSIPFNNNCLPLFKKCSGETKKSQNINKNKINIITREQQQKFPSTK